MRRAISTVGEQDSAARIKPPPSNAAGLIGSCSRMGPGNCHQRLKREERERIRWADLL